MASASALWLDLGPGFPDLALQHRKGRECGVSWGLAPLTRAAVAASAPLALNFGWVASQIWPCGRCKCALDAVVWRSGNPIRMSAQTIAAAPLATPSRPPVLQTGRWFGLECPETLRFICKGSLEYESQRGRLDRETDTGFKKEKFGSPPLAHRVGKQPPSTTRFQIQNGISRIENAPAGWRCK